MQLTDKGQAIQAKLIASGFKEDEIDVLFKNEEELIAYYEAQNAAKTVEIKDDDTEAEEPEPEDTHRLTPEQERSTLEAEHRRQTEEQRAAFDKVSDDRDPKPKKKTKLKPRPASETPEEVAKQEPKEEPVEKVDFDDFLKSITDGYKEDDKNIPNN